MFRTLILITTVAAFSTCYGAVSISGNYATNLRRADGTTAATGNRYIVVADTNSNGFGTGGYAAGSLTIGSIFGGDTIIDTGTVAGTFGGRAFSTIASQPFDLAPYAGKSFALIWFDNLTGTSATDGLIFGRFSGSTWLLPATEGSNNLAFTTGTLSAASPYTTDTTIKSASGFTVAAIPEPSRVMLLGFGLIGLFFRRRR